MNFNRLANLLCAVFFVLLAGGLACIDFRALNPLALLLVFPLAIFLADLLSGIVHIFFDYRPINLVAGFDRMYAFEGKRSSDEFRALRDAVYAHPSTTIIDRLAYTFKIHHFKPKAMNRKTYAVHMLETLVPATVLALLSFLLPPEAALTLLLAAFLVANVQFVHACVHDTHRSVHVKALVHWLQRARLMYSFEAHMWHHRHGVSNFCLVTGWADVLLNPVFSFLLRHGIIRRANWTAPGTPLR